MKTGQYIEYNIDCWTNGKYFLKKCRSKIIDICYDPLKIVEPKCGVKVNGEEYGIPFSEVLSVSPADNEQLTLKL